MAPQASAVDSDNLFIPLVDFSLFQHGTPSERLATARSILHGFQTAGFIYLSNVPIPSSTISTAFSQSAEFFKRPQAQKDALGWTTPEANRGYVAHGREKVTNLTDKSAVEQLKASSGPDLKESFEIGRDDEAGRPNNWPSHYDSSGQEFEAFMKEFFQQCKELHVEVMRAIAIGMDLDARFFDGYTSTGDNTLRLLHYPSVNKSVFNANRAQVRAGEHTDYGSITLLFQDDRGGLQVKSPNGTFVDATPIPGTVVVNAGDLLARWSNDTIKSTVHRVVEPPLKKDAGEEAGVEIYPPRYSIAYFCNPNFDSYIDAIPGTWGGELGEKRYEGVNTGEYLVRRLAATY